MNNSSRSTGTNNRQYKPPPPEAQSALSIWAVRAELLLTIALVLAVVLYTGRRQEPEPVAVTTTLLTAAPLTSGDAATDTDAANSGGPDALKGQVLFMQSCASCHGQSAQGLPRMGVNLRKSSFVASTNNLRLIAFLKIGRSPMDAKNTTGVPMPPRGGNLALDEESLADIVAFLRQVQQQ
jgi:cytochrome c5